TAAENFAAVSTASVLTTRSVATPPRFARLRVAVTVAFGEPGVPPDGVAAMLNVVARRFNGARTIGPADGVGAGGTFSGGGVLDLVDPPVDAVGERLQAFFFQNVLIVGIEQRDRFVPRLGRERRGRSFVDEPLHVGGHERMRGVGAFVLHRAERLRAVGW